MTYIEIITLLEEIYEEDFLNSITFLLEKEPEYKKSAFYKKTKISLPQLYEKYFVYKNAKYSFEDKMNEFITNIDIDKLTNLTLEWLEKLQNNERISQTISKVLENFDFSYLEKNNEDLKQLLEQFKDVK